MQDTLLIILGIIGWVMVATKLSAIYLAHKFPTLTRSLKEEKAGIKNG